MRTKKFEGELVSINSEKRDSVRVNREMVRLRRYLTGKEVCFELLQDSLVTRLVLMYFMFSL